jgi:hypothetical protein
VFSCFRDPLAVRSPAAPEKAAKVSLISGNTVVVLRILYFIMRNMSIADFCVPFTMEIAVVVADLLHRSRRRPSCKAVSVVWQELLPCLRPFLFGDRKTGRNYILETEERVLFLRSSLQSVMLKKAAVRGRSIGGIGRNSQQDIPAGFQFRESARILYQHRTTEFSFR